MLIAHCWILGCKMMSNWAAGSNFGYLSQEDFVDAMGRIGIHAYSEPPYCPTHLLLS